MMVIADENVEIQNTSLQHLNNESGGPVVARKMESCESAALSRDLKTRQRLEFVRSEKLTKMGGIMVWVLVLPDMAGSSSWPWKTCQS